MKKQKELIHLEETEKITESLLNSCKNISNWRDIF